MNKREVIYRSARSCLLALALALMAGTTQAQREMEQLDRGVVAVSTGSGNYVGWRMFGTEDPATTGFNVYRDGLKLNGTPITTSTNYLDGGGGAGDTYTVAAVESGVEQAQSAPVSVQSDYHREIPLQRPPGGTTADSVSYTYSPNDISVGDLDGDGQYELVLKWKPSNAKDNAQSGYTGNTIIDAYEMDGTFLWRVDLGINIRAGEHYTQFMVYDLDGDGRAEMVCKTADGSTDGLGAVLGDPQADWRNGSGYILDGPEYLSAFDGQTGAFIDTVNYNPPRGNVADWGDNYGNRVDRFLACVAYCDGVKPSVVMCRGYYTRTVLAAWDLVGGQLVQRWVFDSDDPGNSAYAGQGNHNLSVADVDADGKDEIIYGSMTVDDDGTGLYSTGLGHGDALHVSDMDPNRPGLEVWMPHETSLSGATFRDAATGAIIFEHYNAGDIGRGVAAHIDAGHYGYQMWSTALGDVFDVDGNPIGGSHTGKMWGFVAWWTSDLQREFLGAADGAGTNAVLEKWGGTGPYRYISLYNVGGSYDTKSINGTKATPCFSGDILGDWREELIYHTADSTKLRIFTTTEVSNDRIYTLAHDPQYRLALAWQNVGYNQPPHPSFYIGAGMATPPTPNIVYAGAPPDSPPAAPSGLVATAISQSEVDLSWTPSATATSYNVKRATSSGGPYTTIANPTAALFADAGLDPDTTYYYVVSALNVVGESADSAEANATTFPAPPPTPNLVAHYALDGDVTDSSGYGFDAVASGAPAYTTGQTGQAMDLDGVDDFFTAPAVIADTADITVAAWVNWNGGGSWQRIFDFGNGTSEYLFLTPSSGSGTLRFAILTPSSGGEQILETTPLATGQWVHVAVTLSGDTGTLYVDGVPADTGVINVDPAEIKPASNYIGQSQWPDPLLSGAIDDFRVYNYALSGAEISGLASGGADTTPPAAPTGLGAVAGDGSVDLDWADNGEPDLGSYTVYRSLTSGSGYSAIASGLGPSAYTDNTASNGTTYYYVVTATDTSANESANSSEVSATPADTTPPAAPSGLAAVAGDGSVDLDWADNGESDLDSYTVYRSLTSGSGYSAIASGLGSSAYTDNSVTNDTTYYYVVTATDTVSNESGFSGEASATPQASGGPVTTTAGGETTVSGTVSGSLTDTHSSDDVYEAITEVESGGKPSKRHSLLEHSWTIDASGTNATLFVEAYQSNSPDGDNFTFSYSTDGTNFTTAFTITNTTDTDTPVSVVIGDVTGPVTVRVVDTDHSQGNRDLDTLYVDHLYIETGPSGPDITPPTVNLTTASGTVSGPFDVDVAFSESVSGLSLGDFSVANGSADSLSGSGPNYTVNITPAVEGPVSVTLPADSAQDAASNGNLVSNTLDVTYAAGPAAPTGLNATAGDGSVDLDWADNSEPDLDSYSVYRSLTSGSGYSVIASDLTASAYTDATVTNGTTYYYVVSATNTSANESGFSSEVSATPESSGGTATDTHVESIVLSVENLGQGNKRGIADVFVYDNLGQPVQGATVTGTFTGDFNLTTNATTDANGLATLQTGSKKGSASFTFCVDGVSHASLGYDIGANVETCDSL